MQASRNLYQQLILEHNKSPRNFGEPSDFTHFAEGVNPMCGDQYRIWVKLSEKEKDTIEKVHFDGQGCAISKASASIMTDQLKGKTVSQAHTLFEQFRKMIQEGDEHSEQLGKLQIFSSVHKFPARVKCAILAWHAFEGALRNEVSVSTE